MQVLATTTELRSSVTSSKHTVEQLAIQNFQYLATYLRNGYSYLFIMASE